MQDLNYDFLLAEIIIFSLICTFVYFFFLPLAQQTAYF